MHALAQHKGYLLLEVTSFSNHNSLTAGKLEESTAGTKPPVTVTGGASREQHH